jgi:signal transduction histidine kinase
MQNLAERFPQADRDQILATAADVIGTNLDAVALDESGPSEVARAASAFNRMQVRLKRLVQGQTEMLAALSHDLRSAATRLQLRAELLDNEAEREGMLRVVSDTRHMIKYGQQAWVSCVVEPGYIRIIVEDQGPGVAEHELQNILKPFYRLDGSRNRDSGGIGLGLAITQNIVQLHGGKVLISNRAGNAGLHVEIALPRP